MVKSCRNGHVIDGFLARLKVELNLHPLNTPPMGRWGLSIKHIHDGLAFQTLLRGVADTGRQCSLVAIAQEARQVQFCHQFLLRHDGLFPRCRHHILGVCQTVEMP